MSLDIEPQDLFRMASRLVRSRLHLEGQKQAFLEGTHKDKARTVIESKLKVIQPAIDWEVDRVKHAKTLIDNTVGQDDRSRLRTRLWGLAVDRQLDPIPMDDSFYSSSSLPADTADWLLSYCTSPFTTSPNHAALKEITAAPEKPQQGFQLYLRCRQSTCRRERERLLKFQTAFPSYSPEIQAKIEHLHPLQDDTVICITYIGQTIGVGPFERYQEDIKQEQASLMHNWTRFIGEPYKIFEFHEMRRVTSSPRSDSAAGAIWLSRPDLWTIEFAFVTAACKASFNSATGGIPRYTIKEEVKEVIAKAFSDSLAKVAIRPQPAVDSDRQCLRQKLQRHMDGMVYTYNRLGKDRRVISALAQSEVIDEWMDGHGFSLILAKDLPANAAGGHRGWNSVAAGPSPKLWRHLLRTVRAAAEVTDEKAPWLEGDGFVDFWCITLLHRDIFIACIFLCRILVILNPKVICVRSDKCVCMMKMHMFSLKPSENQDFFNMLREPSSDYEAVKALATVLRTKLENGWEGDSDIEEEDSDTFDDSRLAEAPQRRQGLLLVRTTM
jgi:hypothetical protein